MKVAILAGGLGTRMREETEFRPKPMVEVGGKPILWHIMQGYARYGFREFVVCLGYKGDFIRDYFINYRNRHADVTVTLADGHLQVHDTAPDQDWSVTLAETGAKTQTGGRLKQIGKYIEGDHFMATYGDGVANINIRALLNAHAQSGKLATVTAVHPSSRFGELSVQEGLVSSFEEKPQVQASWINGGYFVFHKSVLDLIKGNEDTLEVDVLKKLADMQQLAVYQHNGFWQCMDTLREVELLNKLWDNHSAPWATPEPTSAQAAGTL